MVRLLKLIKEKGNGKNSERYVFSKKVSLTMEIFSMQRITILNFKGGIAGLKIKLLQAK